MISGVDFPAFYLKITYESHHKIYNLTFPISMKLLLKNPSTMKSQGQPNFYFSAYPLKVIKEQESEKKSYLHIYTNSKSKKKYAEGLKILPMVNPYSKKDEARLLQSLNKQTQQDNVEERDSDWFASYE
jgi:hypothetical protein